MPNPFVNKVWTRENDAVLAEKCEGLEVTWVEDWSPKGSEPHIPSTKRRDWLDRVAFYDQDIRATIRATEAWRKGDEGSWWAHGVGNDGTEWAVVAGRRCTGPSALAWALWEACQ
jgi:hypothetical protein